MVKVEKILNVFKSFYIKKLFLVVLCMIAVACNTSRSDLSYNKNDYNKKEIVKQFASKHKEKISKKNQDKDAEELFASAEIIDDGDLGDIRGAFMTSNGMKIDIGLITETLVNGAMVNKYEFNSNDALATSNGMQQMIKISSDGQVDVQNLEVQGISSFLTVIQNSANNQSIQNFNILNLDVSNIQNFRNQSLVPTLNFHSSF